MIQAQQISWHDQSVNPPPTLNTWEIALLTPLGGRRSCWYSIIHKKVIHLTLSHIGPILVHLSQFCDYCNALFVRKPLNFNSSFQLTGGSCWVSSLLPRPHHTSNIMSAGNSTDNLHYNYCLVVRLVAEKWTCLFLSICQKIVAKNGINFDSSKN